MPNLTNNNNCWQIDYEGSKRLENYIVGSLLIIGGFCFYLTGLSVYLNFDILPFVSVQDLKFVPQGFTMMFYGSFFFFLGIFQAITIILNIGSGYIKFDKNENQIKIVRKGYPGKTKQIFLSYNLKQIRSIKILYLYTTKKLQRVLLCFNDGREIPILSTIDPTEFDKSEKNILELSKNLDIVTEIVYSNQNIFE
jgi:hypothetical protein